MIIALDKQNQLLEMFQDEEGLFSWLFETNYSFNCLKFFEAEEFELVLSLEKRE